MKTGSMGEWSNTLSHTNTLIHKPEKKKIAMERRAFARPASNACFSWVERYGSGTLYGHWLTLIMWVTAAEWTFDQLVKRQRTAEISLLETLNKETGGGITREMRSAAGPGREALNSKEDVYAILERTQRRQRRDYFRRQNERRNLRRAICGSGRFQEYFFAEPREIIMVFESHRRVQMRRAVGLS
ncbi:hypothetical protein B0H13DRAFT_1900679 [Mycena leptocephala]|nr:hypothetical protein B0H13DRAFT_1900679 [Mycena leptocephala]